MTHHRSRDGLDTARGVPPVVSGKTLVQPWARTHQRSDGSEDGDEDGESIMGSIPMVILTSPPLCGRLG